MPRRRARPALDISRRGVLAHQAGVRLATLFPVDVDWRDVDPWSLAEHLTEQEAEARKFLLPHTWEAMFSRGWDETRAGQLWS